MKVVSVTLVNPQLGVKDVPLGPESHHSHLADTPAGVCLELDDALAALMVVYWKSLYCFSKYLILLSTPLCNPFVLAFCVRARRDISNPNR